MWTLTTVIFVSLGLCTNRLIWSGLLPRPPGNEAKYGLALFPGRLGTRLSMVWPNHENTTTLANNYVENVKMRSMLVGII